MKQEYPFPEIDSPEDVMGQISSDFKMRSLTHADAAKMLGYKNKQTVSNILSSKKYMSKKMAKKFSDAFGYDEDYLTSGKGDLYVEDYDPELEDLIAKDFEDRGSYYEVDTSKFRIAKNAYDCVEQLLSLFKRVSKIIGFKTLLLLTEVVDQHIQYCINTPYDENDEDTQDIIYDIQKYGFISIERLVLKLKEDMKEGRIVVKNDK